MKRWADAHDWRATIEEAVLDGLGSVDVALRKGERSVACEISITTEASHEAANVQKCLAAGFEQVVVVAADNKALGKLKKAMLSAIPEAERSRLHFEMPDGLFALLASLDAAMSVSSETVRGYKVNLKYSAVGTDEKVAKRQAISRVIAGAFKRLKGHHTKTT